MAPPSGDGRRPTSLGVPTISGPVPSTGWTNSAGAPVDARSSAVRRAVARVGRRHRPQTLTHSHTNVTKSAPHKVAQTVLVARWPPEHFGAGAGTGKTVVLIHRAPRRVPPRRRQRVSPNVAPLAPYECGLAIPLIRQIIAGGQRSASNPVHKVGWEPCGCTAGHTRHLLVPALRARVGGPAVRADRGRHLAGAGFGPAELAAPTRGAVTDGGGGVRWPPRRPSTRGASPLFSGWWRAPRVVHSPVPTRESAGTRIKPGSPVPSPALGAVRDETKGVTIPASL